MARLRAVTQEPQTIGGTISAAIDSVRGKVTRLSPDERSEILPWLHRVELARRNRSIFPSSGDADSARPAKPFTIPKPNGPRPFEVVGIPFEAPGLYVVEIESARLGAALLGKSQPMYVRGRPSKARGAFQMGPGELPRLGDVARFRKAREGSVGRDPGLQRAGALGRADTDRRRHRARARRCPRATSCRAVQSKRENDEPFDYYDSAQTEALASIRAGLFVTARTANDLFVRRLGMGSRHRGLGASRLPAGGRAGSDRLTAHTVFDRPALSRRRDRPHEARAAGKKSLEGFSGDLRSRSAEEAPHPPSRQRSGNTICPSGVGSPAGSPRRRGRFRRRRSSGSYEVVFTNGGRKEWPFGRSSGVEERFRVPLMRAER